MNDQKILKGKNKTPIDWTQKEKRRKYKITSEMESKLQDARENAIGDTKK